MGEIKDNKFVPGLALLDLISRYSDKKVFLNQKGQEMFLYGRDVFEENITKGKDKEGFVLVQNQQDENLGYGEMIAKKKKNMLKCILDKGDFLRRDRQ